MKSGRGIGFGARRRRRRRASDDYGLPLPLHLHLPLPLPLPLRPHGRSIIRSHLRPVIVKLGKRIFFGGFFVELDAEAWFIVEYHDAVLHLRGAGEDLKGAFAKVYRLLDAEIPIGHIDVSICGMAYGRDVARTVPRRPYVEPF